MLEELAAGFPILSCLLFLPLVGAAVLWLVDDEDMVRTSALTMVAIKSSRSFPSRSTSLSATAPPMTWASPAWTAPIARTPTTAMR